MYLVQLLLPLYDNEKAPLPGALFRRVRDELTARFGGLTAYTRAPAEGVWGEAPSGEAPSEQSRDDIVIYEVMAESLDRAWWATYRAELERLFRQEVLVVRAQSIEML